MRIYRIEAGPPFAWLDDAGEQRTARPPQATITNPADDVLFHEACRKQGQSRRISLVHSVAWHAEQPELPSSAEMAEAEAEEIEAVADRLEVLTIPELRDLADVVGADLDRLRLKREIVEAIAHHIGPRGHLRADVSAVLEVAG